VPVVVKPQDGNQGRGVTANLVDYEQVKAAYLTAAEISSNVLVERYVTGYDYRMLVVGN
jgi:cyanophycin synthetase